MESQVKDTDRVEWFATFVAVLSVLVYLAWACYPLLNTIWIYPDGQGGFIDRRYTLSWFLLCALGVNIFPAVCLFWVLEKPDRTSRTDFYFLVTIITFLVNLVVFGFFLFFYFSIWTNTPYTGAEPFNDPKWCCVFVTVAPEYCPNTPLIPCSPALIANDLSVNAEFIGHWVATGVFFLMSTLHWILQRVLHQEGVVVNDPEKSKDEGHSFGLAFAIIFLLVYLYWAAVPNLNTVWIDGYPLIAIPPGPGAFKSNLFGFSWVVIMFLGLNLFVIAAFFWALSEQRSSFQTGLVYWVTIIVLIVTTFSAFSIGMIWLFDCNRSWSGNSVCKDYEWCCNNFDKAPELCPNTTPCPYTPKISINSEFFQHFIFSLIFIAFDCCTLWMSARMKRYGIMQ